MVNGQYKNDIGKTRLSVFCNTKDSFAIYAVGYSNDTLGNTEMVVTSGSGTGLVTGTSTSGNTSNWAMKIEPVAGTGANGSYTPTVLSPFNNFTNVPSTWAKVAEVASATSGTTVEGAIDASYAIYIAPNQPAGAYTGKVRYTVVHPNTAAAPFQPQPVVTQAGKIGYVPNASGVVDTMGDQDAKMVDEFAFENDCNNANGYVDAPLTCRDYSDDSIITIPLTYTYDVHLWASNFKRPGYGFAGWNTAYDYSGTTYGPNETVTSPSDVDTNGWTLYAVWVKSVGNLQNWNGCSSLAQGQVTALTDTRDNNTYAVAKLADGKCWMIENLRLGGTSPITLTPADSNVATNFTLSASQDPTQTAWCMDHNETCIDQSMLNSNNTTNSVSIMDSAEQNIYSYGNYYNWYSATAGTGTYSIGTNNTSVASSVCPAGWRLPTGGHDTVASGQNGDFYVLATILMGEVPNKPYGDYSYYEGVVKGVKASKLLRAYPNNYVYSGYVSEREVYYRGLGTYVRSSTVRFSGGTHELSIGSAGVVPGTNGGSKTAGSTVRCLVAS